MTIWTGLLCVVTLSATSGEFAEPVRLKAGDAFIQVDSPGYACPSMFDVDGDEKPDLVVGQFAGGKMHFFKNVSQGSEPEFAQGAWINTDGQPAKVPGVW